MTLPLTNTQRVSSFMLKAGRPVYLSEIIRATRLTKNQASGVLSSLQTQDIVEALGIHAPGHARRFIVRNPEALQARIEGTNVRGGDMGGRHRLDFGPLLAAMGAIGQKVSIEPQETV